MNRTHKTFSSVHIFQRSWKTKPMNYGHRRRRDTC
jgi:hypothetical protein